MASATSQTTTSEGGDKPFKWVKQEIESSDPEQDYEKIWRLSIEYNGGGDFFQNLIYATTFSNFIASDWGSDAVWRNDGGKVLHKATDRYYGPHHQETKKSVDIINKRHEYDFRTHPGAFSHHVDYTYVLCFMAISVHRLRSKLRLSGFTEKQKKADYIFWIEMSRLLLVESPGKPLQNWKPLTGLSDFPADWDGMVEFCEDFENHHMARTYKGHMIAEALFDQFAFRYFPPMLRPPGRALPITRSLPQTLKAHRIQPTHPALARIIIFLVVTFMWIMETFAPYLKTNYQEYLQSNLSDLKSQNKGLDTDFPSFFAQNHQGSALFWLSNNDQLVFEALVKAFMSSSADIEGPVGL